GRAWVAVVRAARSRRLDRIGGTARARGFERDELADLGGVPGRGLRAGRAGGRLCRVRSLRGGIGCDDSRTRRLRMVSHANVSWSAILRSVISTVVGIQ